MLLPQVFMNKDIKEYIRRKRAEYQAYIEKHTNSLTEYTEKAEEEEEIIKETQEKLKRLVEDEKRLDA